MGLYLCVFDGDEELEGVEVGSYSDFEFFRSTVTELLEDGKAGSKYPNLILHADSDGEWAPAECKALKKELASISNGLEQFPPVEFRAEWQQQLGKLLGLKRFNLNDCFIDVDGESLLERLDRLCDIAIENEEPIIFQ
jgi:hypothetical protein